MNKIGIVYFAYLNTQKNWKSIIRNQLADVKRSGIFESSRFYVVVSNPHCVSHEVICDFFNKCLCFPEISIFDENKYEYFGIHKVWELAKSEKHDYLIYFHTKGMSYRSKCFFSLFGARSIREKILTYYLFSKYKEKLNIFSADCSINKIAFLNYKDENRCFTWFNFFWIRASYVNKLQEPIVTEKRYYYESWNGMLLEQGENLELSDCYSLYHKDKLYCNSSDASDILSHLRKLYKYTFPLSFLFLIFRYK